MAYNKNIPLATDRLKDSQSDIKANFLAIPTLWDVNHYSTDEASADQGKHRYVSLIEQAVNPTTAADEVGLFSKESDFTAGRTVLSYRNESDGNVYDIGDGGASWGVLPNGMLYKLVTGSWQTSAGGGVITGQNPSFVLPFATSPKLTGISYVNFMIWDSASSDIDANMRFKSLDGSFTANQTINLFISKRTSSSVPTDNFQFTLLAISTPQ